MVEEKTIESKDLTKDYKDFKSKKPFKGNRSMRRGFKRRDGSVPTHGGNDFSFWNEYPELMNIATKFPWMHIAGTVLKGDGVNVTLQNVAVQHYISIPGVCSSATDPLNLAFRQMYLDMHRKYRGIGAYQASDIAITLVCIESVLQLIVEAERIYGILKGYPIKSRIEPEALLHALGYSSNFITSVKVSLANYRYGINRLIELAKRLPMPQGMNFFKNHVALNGFTYKDSNDERADILVFAFDNYYQYTTSGDADQINNAGSAKSKPFDRGSFTSYSQFLNLIETELTKLLTDTDILRITSDFISCYGESNMQVLSPLPEDYKVSAEYSESILHKWHNSERIALTNNIGRTAAITYAALGSTTQTTDGAFQVYQLNDVVISKPVLSVNNAAGLWVTPSGGTTAYRMNTTPMYSSTQVIAGHIADSWEAEPSQEKVCEAMLWRNRINYLQGSVSGAPYFCNVIQSAVTEILTDLRVCAAVNGAVPTTVNYPATIKDVDGASNSIEAGLCHFDWHPLLLKVNTAGDIIEVYGDVDNVTVVSEDVIEKVVDAALLSAFKVTTSGSASRD